MAASSKRRREAFEHDVMRLASKQTTRRQLLDVLVRTADEGLNLFFAHRCLALAAVIHV
jgi:hypothetical protein